MLNSVYEPQRDLDPKLYLVQSHNSTCTAHFHQSIEIIYILNGQTEVFCAGKSFFATNDDIIFFSEYTTHRIAPCPISDSIHLIIPPFLLADYYKSNKDKSPASLLNDKKYNKTLLPFFKSMLNANRSNNLLMRGYIDLLLGLICQNYPLYQFQYNRDNDLIYKIIIYINERYRENITLVKTAATFGYSNYYFSKIFNRHIGTTFLNYLNTIRLKNMIADPRFTEKTITNLAMEYGFESSSTFYRNFKNFFQMSPSEYFDFLNNRNNKN